MSDTPTKPIHVPKELSMSDFVPPVVSPPVSPTGLAVIPPKAVPFIAAGWMALGSLVLSLPPGQVKTVLSGILTVGGPLLGIVCPGWRQSVASVQRGHWGIKSMVAASALCFASAIGCATLKAWWGATVDCARHDEPEMLAQLPRVIQALAAQDYVTAVDQVVSDVGEIAQCDVALLSAPPSSPPSGLSVIQQPSTAVQGAAAQYLAAKKLVVVNVKSVAVP